MNKPSVAVNRRARLHPVYRSTMRFCCETWHCCGGHPRSRSNKRRSESSISALMKHSSIRIAPYMWPYRCFFTAKPFFRNPCSRKTVFMSSLMEVKDMSVTYTNETNERPLESEAPYVPAYARSRKTARKGKGGLKTWMILAPISVLTIGGIGVATMMGGEQSSGVEADVATPAPVASQPVVNEVAVAPLTSAATPAPVEIASAPAPVARNVAPAREAAPVRRAAPVTPRVETAPVPTGPQPYSASPSATTTTPTSTLNRAPVVVTPAPATAAPAAPAPVIVIQPAG